MMRDSRTHRRADRRALSHLPPRALFALALVAALAAAGSPSILARTAELRQLPALELNGPAPGSAHQERDVQLSWNARPGATEYVVFVSDEPLAGRDAASLLADAAVRKFTTTATAVRLQEIVRGGEGETVWHWAVAARAGGALELSQPSDFRALKTYQGSTRPADPMIVESARGTLPLAPEAESAEIRLRRSVAFDPLSGSGAEVPPNLAAAPVGPNETGAFLVQLRGPVLDGQRLALEAAGARIFAYVPEHTFIVRMNPAIAAAVSNLPAVRWVGPYHPAYKISAQPEMEETSGPRSLVVLLFPDADLAAEQAAFAAMGGAIQEATDSGRNKILRLEVDMSRVPDIAARAGVAWVEPYQQPMLVNQNDQWVVQTFVNNSRRVWDMGIRGENQVITISDSGIRTTHVMFRDSAVPLNNFGQYPTHRKIIAYEKTFAGAAVLFGDHSASSYHGTHTSCTVAGDDSPFTADLRDGMSLKSKIYFQDGGAASNAIFAPQDMNIMFTPAYAGNAGGAARISSGSWSAATNGEYTVLDMTADQFMYDHKDFLTFFSTGNDGAPLTSGSPANNKNGVGSGATQNGTNAILMMPLSSQGPTQDGRTKPTIVAPGMSISSASGAGDQSYQSLTGTSMSCPSKAGATALIRQYFTEGWYPTGAQVAANAFNPSGALMKAMAISSTDNDMAGFNIPNTTNGWGRIKVDNVLFFPGDARRTAVVDNGDGLATGEFVEYQINVTSSAVPLKFTLVWFDKEGNPAAAQQLVNNLDLTVVDPTNVTYLGNVFAGGQSAPGGVADAINVEEGVRRDAPATGIWRVRVSGTNVPFGPQPYALVVNGAIGAQNGVVLLDRLSYGRDDLIEVRVEDLDAVSPISVTLSSNTEASEVVSIAGANGVFVATVPTTAFSAVGGDGKLSVSHGDAITVSYTDVSPAATVSAQATANFNGPVITGVSASDQGAGQSITWNTNVLATSRVYYGATTALGLSVDLGPALSSSHSVTLAGLNPETDYYFDVESADHGGNVTRDDNGGNHYRFTTGKRGEILLVIGDGTFTDKQMYLDALQARGWDATVWDGAPILNPSVGNLSSGMRSFHAVWWQVGLEQYPPFDAAARDSVTAYVNGGGRFAVSSHDVAWALGDLTSGFGNAASQAWLANTLHIQWLEDPLIWPAITGIAGDPISDAYQGGLAYVPHREGAAGDEIGIQAGTGTGNFVWRNTDATANNIAVRWANGVPNGSPGGALWGGQPSRVLTNCLEWSKIVDDAARTDVLDKSLIWLIGNDHPDPVVTAPNGGEVITGNSTTISWNETAYGGATIASRRLLYSSDAGASWNLITATPGTSPYNWDVSTLPNSSQYLVRVELLDSGTPALPGDDVSDALFTLARPGGDTRGPVVVAGSIRSNPNPMDNTANATLFATVTDAGQGDGTVAAAEWSWGVGAAAAGSGNAMGGTFGTTTVDVSATVSMGTVQTGEQKFWVRGRDADGTWGNATAHTFVVNGNPVVAVGDGERPLAFALHQNAPNPFGFSTAIRFALPQPSQVELAVYNVRGEKVRTLVSGRMEAGSRVINWDGRTDTGVAAKSGVYFYRIEAGAHSATRKMVMLQR